MANLAAVHLALRARAETVQIATTGVTSLAATTTGYTRTAGSFIADGFTVGSEITPSGFATNTRRVITRVQALTLSVSTTVAAESNNGGRSLTVGLPALFAKENTAFTPIAGRPYLVEEFIPTTNTLRAGPSANGVREESGLYDLRWYGLANTGVLGIRQAVDALAARFTPGTTLTAGSDVVRVRGDLAPFSSHIGAGDDGWALCVLSIPWRVYSANIVAV